MLKQPVPRCEKCGGLRRRIGFLPHATDPALRLDLYRCECGERDEVVVPVVPRNEAVA